MKKTLPLILVCSALVSTTLLSGCKSENEKEFDKLKEEQIVFTINDLPGALVKAINERQEILVKRLLFAGAQPNSTDEYGNSALMLACNTQNNELIDTVLSYSPDVNQTNKDKETALFIAVSQGNVALLDKLIKAGGALNQINANGYSLLAMACATQNPEILNKLLECGADPNQQVSPGSEPICVALDNGCLEIFTTLLQHKANINVTTASEAPLIGQIIAMDAPTFMQALLTTAGPLTDQALETASQGMSMAINMGSEEMVRLLLGAGITPSPENGSAVKQAVISTNMGIIQAVVENSKELDAEDPWVKVAMTLAERHKLIQEGVLSTERMMDPNTKLPRWGQIMKNALINAISKNNTTLAQRLLKAGASPYATGGRGSAVEYAISVDNADILKMLHEAGAPFEEAGEPHALGKAAEINACKCIEYMLSQGVPVDMMSPNDQDKTPLRRAINNKCIDAATLLINNGADVNNKAPGMDPITFDAVNISSLKLVELMLAKGVYVDTYVYITGETLLMRAAKHSTAAMVELLINSGANPNEVNTMGASPVIYAAWGLNLDTMKMLESKGANLKYKMTTYEVRGLRGFGTFYCNAETIAYWSASRNAPGKTDAIEMYRYLIEKGAAREGSPEIKIDVRLWPSPTDHIHGDYPEYISDSMKRAAKINHDRMQAKRGTAAPAATTASSEQQSAAEPAAASSEQQSAAEPAAAGNTEAASNNSAAKVSDEALEALKPLYDRLAKLKCKEAYSALCQKKLLLLLDCIRNGDDVNCTIPETKGCAAIHYACSLGSVSITEWLLKNGADPNAKTAKGADPMTCIGSDNRAAISKLLKQYGAK